LLTGAEQDRMIIANRINDKKLVDFIFW